MIGITSHSLLQFIVFLIDLMLLTIIGLFSLTKHRKVLIGFLTISAVWAFFSFMSNQLITQIPYEQVVFWGKYVAFFCIFTALSYAYFIACYIGNKKAVKYLKLGGIVILFVDLILINLGYIPRSFDILPDGVVYKNYGLTMLIPAITGLGAVFVAFGILVKKLRVTREPESRNRLTYLIIGSIFVFAFGAYFAILPVQEYSTDHLGHCVNAALITYAVLRHRLVNIRLFLRKGVVFAVITVAIIAIFASTFILSQLFFQQSFPDASLVLTTITVIAIAALFNPVRIALENIADHLIYGSKYDSRVMLKNFASRMNNVIDMNELAEALLAPIVAALGARQANLLFQEADLFTSRFARRLNAKEPPIFVNFRKEGPIIARLSDENEPIFKYEIESETVFRGLWEDERSAIEAAEIELFIPIKVKKKLIAVLTLSKKRSLGYYSKDDIEMLMTLADEAAVVIENAQLYDRAQQRANTDELTGLYNHRYFHERLGEEIARSSRFGNIFSLLFLDLDNFKTYNDVFGHLSGDGALRELADIIRSSIRSIDIGFRYGGDEFAIILPETPLEGASKAAERIRRRFEMDNNLRAGSQSCSIGLASWPTDGVMKEDIVRAVDAALYHAKSTGSNRVCWAGEVATPDGLAAVISHETNNKNIVLNTIYALAATVDAKDHYTYGHSRKVSQYATAIAEALGYRGEDIERVRTSGLLHDIGKIGISDQLLEKKERLNDEEWEIVRAHPTLGVSILKHVESLSGCLAGVQYHHERLDGKGYPSGLKGENIPMDARILAVADSFDAMTSKRPYRDYELSREQAIEQLKLCAGVQFDARIVNAFIEILTTPRKTDEITSVVDEILLGKTPHKPILP